MQQAKSQAAIERHAAEEASITAAERAALEAKETAEDELTYIPIGFDLIQREQDGEQYEYA